MLEQTGTVDRASWIGERRRAVIASYDDDAPEYDAIDYPTETQHAWVSRLVESCPAGGTILDAPCGTGRYFGLIVAAGRNVVGVDQSSGMLAQAESRGLAESVLHVGLQEMDFVATFDGVMCVDAMENVSPEDWPTVLANLRRSVRPAGLVYMTIEEVDDDVVDEAFAQLQQQGLPAVRGEVVEGDVASYHYYPGRPQADEWLSAAGFTAIDEATSQHDGWAYRHLLLRP
jgi:ubiquinone/menaquinone biosynthesis C-methylase UbiE